MMHFQICKGDVSFCNGRLGHLNEGFHIMLEITANDKQRWNLSEHCSPSEEVSVVVNDIQKMVLT